MKAKKAWKKGHHQWSPDKWFEYFITKFRSARRKYKRSRQE